MLRFLPFLIGLFSFSDNSSSFYGSGSPALSRSVTQNQVDAENGVQSFHLVRFRSYFIEEGFCGNILCSKILEELKCVHMKPSSQPEQAGCGK